MSGCLVVVCVSPTWCVCVCVCVSIFFDRKTSRAALRLLRSFLSPLFLLCSCLRFSSCVCAFAVARLLRASFMCAELFHSQKGA